MRRNPLDRLAQGITRGAQVSLTPPAQVSAPQSDRPAQAGENDATTGLWEPYGILGFTLASQRFRLYLDGETMSSTTEILGLPNGKDATDPLLTPEELANISNSVEMLAHSYVSKSVASGVDVTLDPDTEAKTIVLALTGELTANINVVFPAWSGWVWVVRNLTTGAYTLTCKTALGAGVAVPQGQARLVVSDGTDLFAVSGA